MTMNRLCAVFLAFALSGCTDIGNLPSPPAGNEAVRVFVKYGVGGYMTSYGMGPGDNSLAGALASAFGPAVRIVGYYDYTADIAAQMSATPSSIKLAQAGFSCGASAVPQDTAAVTRPVDLAAGIQASLYCGGGALAKNVRHAIEIYNPNCPETLGLGCWLWPLGAGFAPGNFTIVKRYDMHPQADLDPDAWNDIVLALRQVLNPAKALRAPNRNAVQVIVRHSTWRRP